jgi:polar amino acid transport system substrate-binding protein
MCQEGYAAKFNPANKEKPGTAIEMVRAIERIDPQIRVNGLESCASTARIFSELGAGRIDVLFALAKNPEREALGVFIDPPLYTTYQRLAVRQDDDAAIESFDDIRKLGKEGVILVAAATSQATFLKKQEGLALDDGAANTEENLRKLVAGRGRFNYASEMGLEGDLARLGLAGKVKVLPVKFQKEDVYAIFAKKVPASTRERVSAAIAKLRKSGELERIYGKYLSK